MQRKKVTNLRNKHFSVKCLLIIISTLLFIGGVIIGIIHNINNNHIKEVDNESINFFFSKEENIKEDKDLEKDIINYVAVLEIPKINLKQGIPYPNSKENTVDRNIQVIEPFEYPDVEAGNLILASHSGNSIISYFKNLDKLNVNDQVYLYYQNNKYIYKIADIYESDKYQVSIKRDHSKTTLTLTTCSKDKKDKQLVLIAYLVNVSNY